MVRDIVAGGFDGIIVVDEAYVDFSGKESACSLIDELDRVVVLQTLSKAFGMAAIRCVVEYKLTVALHRSSVGGWEGASKPRAGSRAATNTRRCFSCGQFKQRWDYF